MAPIDELRALVKSLVVALEDYQQAHNAMSRRGDAVAVLVERARARCTNGA